MTLQAIIFGIDGVLAETEEINRQAYNQVFAEVGFGWHWDVPAYAALIAATSDSSRISHYVRRNLPHWSQSQDLAQLFAAMYRRKSTIFLESLHHIGFISRPGIRELTSEALRRGIRLAIASRENRREVAGVLTALFGPGGAAQFEVIVDASDSRAEALGYGTYFHVLDGLALPPSACLAIEGSGHGMAAAAAAGVAAIGTRGIYAEYDGFEDAVYVADDLARLVQLRDEQRSGALDGCLIVNMLERLHACAHFAVSAPIPSFAMTENVSLHGV